MKIAWIIPGFGEPNKVHKQSILENNKKMVGNNIELTVFEYTKEKPGIVGMFLKKECQPWKYRDYDIIMLSLDDIEFTQPINWQYIYDNLYGSSDNEKGYDILTPSIQNENTVFPHMKKTNLPYSISHTTVPEFFCYFMKPTAYSTWWGYLRDYNPWLWGMDLIIHLYMGLNAGIMREISMIHHYVGGSHQGIDGRNQYFAELGVTNKEVAEQPCYILS